MLDDVYPSSESAHDTAGWGSLKRVNRSRSAHGRQRRAVDRERILGTSPIDDLKRGSPRERQRNGVVHSFIDCGSGFLLYCSFPSACASPS